MITVGNESDGDEKDGDSEMSVNSSLDKVISKEMEATKYIYSYIVFTFLQAEASVKLNNPSPSVQDTLKQLFAVRKMAIEGLVLLNRNVSRQ